MAKKKVTPKKKCAKKCGKKCGSQNKTICENKLSQKETAVFIPDQPSTLSKIYRYFFPVR